VGNAVDVDQCPRSGLANIGAVDERPDDTIQYDFHGSEAATLTIEREIRIKVA
jgi:hypothetical protein